MCCEPRIRGRPRWPTEEGLRVLGAHKTPREQLVGGYRIEETTPKAAEKDDERREGSDWGEGMEMQMPCI